jgi:hypothetical protein
MIAASDGADAAVQQQALDALLASKEMKLLLTLLLGLHTGSLHIAQNGKSPAASTAPAAGGGDSSSGSRQQRRQQQRQGRRQQQQQDRRLQVPALHSQLLEQFGMQEGRLTGSRLHGVVSQSPSEQSVLAVVGALHALHSNVPVQQGGSGSSNSSMRAGWPEGMLGAVLLALVEVQVGTRPGWWKCGM